MKKIKKSICMFLLSGCGVIFAQPHVPEWRPAFKLEQVGLIDCSDDEQSCEPSAAACLSPEAVGGASIFVASDKSLRKDSNEAVFGGRMIAGKFLPTGLLKFPISAVKKVESMTISNDGSYVLAMTAFDRLEPEYNSLVYWSVGSLHMPARKVKVFDSVGADGSLRSAFEKFYKERYGVSYFKVEGIAAQKNGRLLIGVRSVGKSYKEYSDVVHIFSLGFNVDSQGNPFVYERDVKFEADYTDRIKSFLGAGFGLTDLNVDYRSGNIWILVAHESGDEGSKSLSGRLVGVFPEGDRDLSDAKLLIADNKYNSPLVFDGKPEGMCEISPGRFIFFYDDDREFLKTASPRVRLSQARYEIYVRDDRKPSVLVQPKATNYGK